MVNWSSLVYGRVGQSEESALSELSLALTGSLPVSLWLSVTLILAPADSLAHSGSLWPSLGHYCSLILLTQSLIGSQGP